MMGLPCDDGNILNGDGCSSACEIERSYFCQGGSPTTPSQCTFRADVAITIQSMRGLGNNFGTMTLSFVPETDLFGQMDLKARTLLFVDGNFQAITQAIYS